jgi:transcriptional antiterminator RfaH
MVDMFERTDAQGSGTVPCSGNPEIDEEISSKMCGWGGARANSGGPRANAGGRREGAGRKPNPVPVQEPQPSTEPRWCVFMTHPQAERTAVADISRQGYRAYMPLTVIRRVDPVIRSMFHKVRVPLLPGYGFVELSAADSWVPIRYCDGVRDVLLGMNGRPAPVREKNLIESLMADDERRCDLRSETLPAFAAGSTVQLDEGPFSGQSGVVVACDGITTTVEIQLFGRVVPVLIDRAAVSEA